MEWWTITFLSRIFHYCMLLLGFIYSYYYENLWNDMSYIYKIGIFVTLYHLQVSVHFVIKLIPYRVFQCFECKQDRVTNTPTKYVCLLCNTHRSNSTCLSVSFTSFLLHFLSEDIYLFSTELKQTYLFMITNLFHKNKSVFGMRWWIWSPWYQLTHNEK